MPLLFRGYCDALVAANRLDFGSLLVQLAAEGLQRAGRNKEVEEERRSCFVAITRARETLTLTRAREYFGYRKRASQDSGGDGGWVT